MLIDHLTMNIGVEFVLTGKTNQDCLENFFSRLRGKGGFNYMPSSNEIGIHYANIIVTQLLFKSEYSNCLEDDSDMIELHWDNFQQLYKESLMQEYESGDFAIQDDILNLDQVNCKDQILKKNAISYYAGYCAFKKNNCNECLTQLLKNNGEIPIMSDAFISEKNYNKSSVFGSLKAPTTVYADVANTCLQIFEQLFRKDCHLSNICARAAETCIKVIKRDYPRLFMPLESECYDHLKSLIQFCILVLIRKNSKWSVTSDQFKKSSSKHMSTSAANTAQSSKRLKILSK